MGGIQSGWPHDFLDPLFAQLESQTVMPAEDQDSSWNRLITKVLPNLPEGIQNAAKRLVKAFITLFQGHSSKSSSDSRSQGVTPLYHDQDLNPTGDSDSPWHDRWGSKQL